MPTWHSSLTRAAVDGFVSASEHVVCWQTHMRALAEQAAAQLVGTTKGMADLGVTFEAAENDKVFCAWLDEQAFCCTDCGWWHDHSELNDHPRTGEWICDECYGSATDDDDD